MDDLRLQDMLGQILRSALGSESFSFGSPRNVNDSEEDEDDEDDGKEPTPAASSSQPDDESYQRILSTLRDGSTSIPAKAATLHRLLASLRATRLIPRGFVAVGVPTLCDIVTRNWPPGGDLTASTSEVDDVVALRPPPVAGGGSSGRRHSSQATDGTRLRLSRLPHHSMRRLAAGCLAELSRWPVAVEAMHQVQFFTRLPHVLADLATRYRYGQPYWRMYGRGRCTDQGQYILERLTHTCADAANGNDAVRRVCMETLLKPLFLGYPRMDVRRAKACARLRLRPRPMDDRHPSGPGAVRPAMPWDSISSSEDDEEEEEGEDEGLEDTEEEEARAAWRLAGREQGRRAVNARPGAEVPQLEVADVAAPRGKSRRRTVAAAMEAAEGERGPPSEWDPMPTAFMRLVSSTWFSMSRGRQHEYLEQGVLAALTAFPTDRSFGYMENTLMRHMRSVYQELAPRSFAGVRAADAALRERASQLRLRGNEAFKAGRYEAALALYTDAVALDWDEPAHRNNRCFALTKLGRLEDARAEGLHSVGCEPRQPRSWSRLAAVFEALKMLQAAQLCYRQALALVAPKGDEELQQRLRDVEQRLKDTALWRFETIPPRTFFDRDGKWRNWMAKSLPKAQVRALDRMEQMSPVRMPSGPTGVSENDSPVLTAALASEAYQVSTALRPLWEIACAIEEAAKAPMDPMMQFNVSWSDMGIRDRHTSLPYFTLSCMDAADGLQRNIPRLALGKPRYPAMRNALCSGIARPMGGKPGRPSSVFLAHRGVPYFDKLQGFFAPMGVEILCETQHEAAQSAANYNTDPGGFNHRDHYCDELEDGYSTKHLGGPGPHPWDVASDDDATDEYQTMLAAAAAAAAAVRCAGGAGGGIGGEGGLEGGGAAAGVGAAGAAATAAARRGAERAGLPSDEELREATLELLEVCDTRTTTTNHLLGGLRRRFGTDVSARKAVVQQVTVEYARKTRANRS